MHLYRFFSGAQDRLNEAPKAPNRPAMPFARDQIVLPGCERRDPARIHLSIARVVRDRRRQQGIEVGRPGLWEFYRSEAIAQRRRQWIETIGRGDVGHVSEVDRHLEGGIRIVGGLGFEKAKQAVPESPVVGSGAGFFDLIDDDDGVGMPCARDREKRMARLG